MDIGLAEFFASISETCEGVLGSPPPTHTLELQALTDTAQENEQSLESMCAAV
jgi:hypothetical protein